MHFANFAKFQQSHFQTKEFSKDMQKNEEEGVDLCVGDVRGL